MHHIKLKKKYLRANKAKFYRWVKISVRVIANFACARDKINCMFFCKIQKEEKKTFSSLFLSKFLVFNGF